MLDSDDNVKNMRVAPSKTRPLSNQGNKKMNPVLPGEDNFELVSDVNAPHYGERRNKNDKNLPDPIHSLTSCMISTSMTAIST
jgi:hypothetical protein